MVKFSKTSLSLSTLWVSRNDRLSDFYASSWQRGESAVPMLAIRVLLTICALAILAWSLVEGASPFWIIYLTNWGILLVVATVLSGLVVSFAFVCKRPPETTELPWSVSLHWLMFNISITISVVITALYWILLYNPEVQGLLGLRALWLDITTHGLTSCLMMTELLISRTPVRLAHIYQPLALGLWYSAFSAIYYAAGGTDRNGNIFIYEVLNWEQPKRAAIVIVGSIVALIILYLVLWTIAFIRDKISTKFVRNTSLDLPLTPPNNTTDHRIV